MPTDLARATDRVLDYLAERGGVVEVPPGRALLRMIADDLDWTRAELTAALSQLEADGMVARDVRDRRTYRLRLVGDGEAEADTEGLDHADKTGVAEGEVAATPETEATAPSPADPWSATSFEAAAQEATQAPAARRSRFGRRPKAEKAPKPEKAAKPESEEAPKAEKAPKPEPEKAPKAEKEKRGRRERAPKAPKAMPGVVYEIREMGNRSFEGIAGQPISRHRTNAEAFAELRKLTRARSGGAFRPRVVVRIDADGREDIAIPFDEQDRPLHFAFKLSGGRR